MSTGISAATASPIVSTISDKPGPDVAVIDFCLPDGDALHLMSRLKQADATVPLLILTAHGSIELAVQAIKEGAEQFLTKPLELPTLHITLERVLEHQRNRQKQLARTSRQARAAVDPFLGASAAIRQLAEEVLAVTGSPSEIVHEPLPVDDPTQRQPDIALARTQLGWEPRIGLHEGLTRTADWYRQVL